MKIGTTLRGLMNHKKPGPPSRERTQGGTGRHIPVHHQQGQRNVGGRNVKQTSPYYQSKVHNAVSRTSNIQPIAGDALNPNKFEAFDLTRIKNSNENIYNQLIEFLHDEEGKIEKWSYIRGDGVVLNFFKKPGLKNAWKKLYNEKGFKDKINDIEYSPQSKNKMLFYTIVRVQNIEKNGIKKQMLLAQY